MIRRRRPPLPLQMMAFQSWLRALDCELSSPEECPSSFLLQALSTGAKLSESTIIRVVQAVSLAGVSELDIVGEILNPTMLHQLSRALLAHPMQLTRLAISLSPRLHKNSSLLLMEALENMKSLKDLSLTGGANDALLRSLALANPPLVYLSLSKSTEVTDIGIRIILGSLSKKTGPSKMIETLQNFSLWDTSVTTRGCVWILQRCQRLEALSCQWTLEALLILNLRNHPPIKLTNLLLWEDNITDDKFEIVKKLCPTLKLLTVRRANVMDITFYHVLSNFPLLEDLTVLEFTPFPELRTESISLSYHGNLKRLSLCSFHSGKLDIRTLQKSMPLLKHLTVEGGLQPEISIGSKSFEPFEHLTELRLNSTFCHECLDPNIAIYIVNKLTKKLVLLELGHCENFQDFHFSSLLEAGALEHVVDLSLSGAKNISMDTLENFIENCPQLRTWVFKMVPKEKTNELEVFKKELKSSNVDVELITYGHRW